MPFYEVTGRDPRTCQARSLQISARSEREAFNAAARQGITEIKLRPYSEREMLLLDFKCFLNGDSDAYPPAQTRIHQHDKHAKREKSTDHAPLRTGAIATLPRTGGAIASSRTLSLGHASYSILIVAAGVLLALWIDRLAMMLIDSL